MRASVTKCLLVIHPEDNDRAVGNKAERKCYDPWLLRPILGVHVFHEPESLFGPRLYDTVEWLWVPTYDGTHSVNAQPEETRSL